MTPDEAANLLRAGQQVVRLSGVAGDDMERVVHHTAEQIRREHPDWPLRGQLGFFQVP